MAFKILGKLFMIILICIFFMGSCLLFLGSLLKAAGYLLWLDKAAASDECVDIYNEIKRIF